MIYKLNRYWLMGATIAILVAGCSDNRELSSGPPMQGPFHVPIPREAELIGSSSNNRYVYEVPVDLPALRRWFREHVHIGQSLSGWTWCKLMLFDDDDMGDITFYQYIDPAQGRSLEIMLAKDRGASNAGIAISTVNRLRDCPP